ncbi:uncharacterized protein LOC128556753 isoform X1 [Mercenaria mercenaria]|uniref:uncharacterized protein LOC128556753 isoform X1 n=1 Tax=Mercenaria mercenaria TaxID=6596 RepID=UPI00234F9900|nr:uncharacterized protein LOC128556753 isoform X1 [Mercenaria mercenaria]
MDRQASALVLLIGFYLNCFVTGKGYRSASLADDKEIVSDDSNTLSRHQRDVDVPLEYQGVCGIPPVQIDMRFFRCDDAEIVAKSTSATTTSTPKPNDICSGLLICNGIPYCGADQGYRCCGFELYNPEFQTCCQNTSAKYKVYDDMPEKSHVCCVLDAYKRSSSDIPCEHASSNDRLFRKWKKLVSDQALCTMNERETRQVYKIDIDVQESKGDRRYLEAKVSMWTWTPSSRSENGTDLRSPPTKKGYMEIRLDKYSPRKKNLTGRSFFTITEKNYLEKAIFFLNPNDNLYKWPKNVKKISNLLQKIQRQCSQKNEQIAK